MKRISLCLILLALTACATAAQRQATNIKSVSQQAFNDLKTCTTQVFDNPDYETIKPHLPSPASNFQPTMAQLADDMRPTKEEGELLIKFHDDLIPCRQVALEKIQSVVPGVAQIMSEEMVEGDTITMQLVKRKITWGEGAHQRQQLVLDSQKQLRQAGQQLDSALIASHQAEINQRQANIDTTVATSQAIANALVEWSVVLLQAQQLRNAAQPANTSIICNNNAMASGTMPNPTICQSY